MGIRGLIACIHACAPDAVSPPDWRALRGATVGVDVLCFVHRGREAGVRPLLHMARQVVAYRRLSIRPLFVFDGRAPPEKGCSSSGSRSGSGSSATAKRTPSAGALTAGERDELKRFLYAAGCLFVQAVGEADTVLAHLARRGEIAAVVSGDMDMLARRVPLLIAPAQGRPATRGAAAAAPPDPGAAAGWHAYDLQRISARLRLPVPAFQRLCLLLGSDYTPDVPAVPWEAALVLARRCADLPAAWEALRATRQPPYAQVPAASAVAQLHRAADLLEGADDTPDSLLRASQWDKVVRGEPPVEPQELAELWCRALAGEAGDQLLQELLQPVRDPPPPLPLPALWA